MDNFKGDFLNILIFLHPQIPDFQILSYPNKPYINGKLIYSAFIFCTNLNLEKNDTYDWFCGPGSHLYFLII